eukprot:4940048-Prymnesium_polylepis.1
MPISGAASASRCAAGSSSSLRRFTVTPFSTVPLSPLSPPSSAVARIDAALSPASTTPVTSEKMGLLCSALVSQLRKSCCAHSFPLVQPIASACSCTRVLPPKRSSGRTPSSAVVR